MLAHTHLPLFAALATLFSPLLVASRPLRRDVGDTLSKRGCLASGYSFYTISPSRSPNWCMVPVSSTGNLSDGTTLDWSTCADTDTVEQTQQLWVLHESGGSGWIQNVVDPHYCLDAGSAQGGLPDGFLTHMWTCGNYSQQQWLREDVDGYTQLLQQKAGREERDIYLDLPIANTSDASNQLWTLRKVDITCDSQGKLNLPQAEGNATSTNAEATPVQTTVADSSTTSTLATPSATPPAASPTETPIDRSCLQEGYDFYTISPRSQSNWCLTPGPVDGQIINGTILNWEKCQAGAAEQTWILNMQADALTGIRPAAYPGFCLDAGDPRDTGLGDGMPTKLWGCGYFSQQGWSHTDGVSGGGSLLHIKGLGENGRDMLLDMPNGQISARPSAVQTWSNSIDPANPNPNQVWDIRKVEGSCSN